jgi:hypothetical protein
MSVSQRFADDSSPPRSARCSEQRFYDVLMGYMRGEFRRLVKYCLAPALSPVLRAPSHCVHLRVMLVSPLTRAALCGRSDKINYSRVLTMLLRLRQACSHYLLCVAPNKAGEVDEAVAQAAQTIGLKLKSNTASTAAAGAGGKMDADDDGFVVADDDEDLADLTASIEKLSLGKRPRPENPPPFRAHSLSSSRLAPRASRLAPRA